MSFVCSYQVHVKMAKQKKSAYERIVQNSGKLPFSEYLGFQSNGLGFSKCQILGLWRRRSWDSWRQRCYGGETALQNRQGSPCSAFLRVSGVS